MIWITIQELYLLVFCEEYGNIAYTACRGIIFPYSPLRTSKIIWGLL